MEEEYTAELRAELEAIAGPRVSVCGIRQADVDCWFVSWVLLHDKGSSSWCDFVVSPEVAIRAACRTLRATLDLPAANRFEL